MDREKIEQGVRLILEGIGEDLDREGLQKTPARVARACEELCGGADENPAPLFDVTFEAGEREAVLVRDISFYSLCEHHLLPFFGVAHVAYVPGEDGRVCGISKLARCVDIYAHRLQLQERLTSQIAEAVEEHLGARGELVMIEAEHLCMAMRGVGKPGSTTVTIASRGTFAEDAEARDSMLAQMRGGFR